MILTYQAHKCSPEGICFTLSEYIPLIKVWTCGPVLWSVSWGVSRRYCRSCLEWNVLYFDQTWWRHQMETFPHYWPFVRGIHRFLVNSPHKGQWRGAFMFSLICVWINRWVNNLEAGDLRCYHAHYDVIVTICLRFIPNSPIDNKSIFVQVNAWCWKAGSHYLNQCWPTSMLIATQHH